MKTAYLEKENIKSNKASYLSELCYQSPFLIINTPCGVGKYKFNKIGYDNNNSLHKKIKIEQIRKETYA